MPSIVVKLVKTADDVRFFGFRSGTTAGPITNVTSFELEDQVPYTNGFPVGGLDSSAGLTENKAQLVFENVVIPKGSKIESAEITVFAKVQIAQFGSPPMQINVSWFDTVETGGQNPITYTSVFTVPVRAEKGTFTLTAGETSFIEKVCDVTGLVQELVNQFSFTGTDLGNGDMRFRMTNKSFTETQQANPYPRTGGGGVTTQIQAQIYSFEQGFEKSAKLTVVYSTPCTETLCDDFSYRLRSFKDRKLIDPSVFTTQGSADGNYPTSDPARIRINAPFPAIGASNRLDLSCPAGIPHNASGTGEDSGGIFGGGNIVSNLQWNYRFKIDITSFVINTDPTGQSVHIGLGDSDNTATSDLAQDYIGFKIGNAGSVGSFQLIGANGIGPDTGGAIEGTFTTPVTTGVFFVELAREGNSGGLSNISCSLFRDKDYSDLIEKVSGVTPTAIANLNRLKFMVKNIDGTGNGLIVVEYGQQVRQPTLADRDTFGEVELKGGTIAVLGNAVAREPAVELETFEDDLDAPANLVDTFVNDVWTDVGVGFGVNLGTNELDWSANIATTNNATERNLGNEPSISPSTWTIRFKLDIDALTNGASAVENQVFFGLSSISSVSNLPTVSQNSIGLMASINNTTVEFRTTWSLSPVSALFSNQTAFTTAVPSVGTVFVEISRTSLTSMTINIYSDETFKTLIESVTDSAVASGIVKLDFIKLSSRSDGTGADSTLNGSIDNLQLFSSLAPVPSNWTETGINIVENQTTGVIDWNAKNDNTQAGTVHDFGSPLSDIKWTCRFKFTINTATVIDITSSQLFMTMSDTATVDTITAEDYIGMRIVLNNVNDSFRIQDSDGIAPNVVVDDVIMSTTLTGNVGNALYIEIKRTSATTYLANIYSDSDYTHLVETASGTCASTTVGLQFLKFFKFTSAGTTSDLDGTIDDVQVWNGQDELESNNNWRVSN